MSLDLPKSYDAKLVEPDVYQRWENAGCFKAGAGKRGKTPYTIAIPPPNVTGVLHMGHALNNTLQDTLIRWRRMQGHDTLWQPGTDHAGIATESVVAKQIQENQAFIDELKVANIAAENPPDLVASKTATGYDRDRFGRTAFLKAVWHWKAKSGGAIINQLRKLGSSCDWSRERFTMDEGLSKAVRTMFVKLHDAGLIYRGTRMVNWCPVQRTALSDDEVEPIEKNGHLWKLKYAIVETKTSQVQSSENAEADLATGGGQFIIVETTRPETFFGDTAVAVNPHDPRYAHLIGRMVLLPIIGREIPIVGDEYANPEKGSGAVKITPAHDPNDYEVGKRHNLPLIRVIDFDGTMTREAAHYAGQDRFVCRKALLKEFEASGVLLGATDIMHAVGHSYRSGVPIEPMVTEQWFVKMAPLAERAVKETRTGNADEPARLHFHPDRWGKVYEHWLANVRDWCISRQIWWGHRIPAWHCAACGKATVAIAAPTTCTHCGSASLTQDPDVLDTWFSSALWPYSTLGWPDWEATAKHYFPTNTLVTDRGIIFFWVARMVMTSLFANDIRPFNDVYIHGTVLDERGDKMSKSKGNGIDPIVMISGGSQMYLKKQYDCPGYGADAVRYTLLDMTTEGQDLKLSPVKFETGRNFANKVWNAGRFLLMNLSEHKIQQSVTAEDLQKLDLGFPERWILTRLKYAIMDCSENLGGDIELGLYISGDNASKGFRFSNYANSAYRFFREDLCDWYLEWAKRQFKLNSDNSNILRAEIAAKVLWYTFEKALRLLHPGMPFITEFLWQHLQAVIGQKLWGGHFLMLSEWPSFIECEVFSPTDIQKQMEILQEIVVAIRNARNLLQIADGISLKAFLQVPDPDERQLIDSNSDFVMDRANLSSLVIETLIQKPLASVSTVVGSVRIHIPVEGLADLVKFKDQLSKRIIVLEKSIAGKHSRLGNADYIARAPAQQVTDTRDLLAKEEIELANLQETLAGL